MLRSSMVTSKVALVLLVAVISSEYCCKTRVLAFVQNGWSYHPRDGAAAKEDRNQRTKGFGEPDIIFSLSRSSSPSLLSVNTNKAEDADPDLFDYFDPLLSPHAYPSGVSPNEKLPFQNEEIQQDRRRNSQQNQSSGSKGQFGIRLPNTEANVVENTSSSTKGDLGFKVRTNSPATSPATDENETQDEDDSFDYFDPLRSPHEYPNGIKSDKEQMTSPSPLDVVGENKETFGKVDGNVNINERKKKIGVLLMDHGSKKEKSNARLQAMAKLYQMTLGTDEDEEDDGIPSIIVRAAHMEIATPSIPDGLKDLKDLGVDEIICHPFFLSADGRHVKEDIPEIIENAIEDLWGEKMGTTPIPIVTTAPVGSNTQLMLGAIHSLVRENSQYLTTTLQNES